MDLLFEHDVPTLKGWLSGYATLLVSVEQRFACARLMRELSAGHLGDPLTILAAHLAKAEWCHIQYHWPPDRWMLVGGNHAVYVEMD